MSISNVLAKYLANYSSPSSIGSKFRAKRIKPLLDLIDETYRRKGHVDIVDLGGAEDYWHIVGGEYLRSRKVTITLVNLPGIYSPPKDSAVFKLVEGDACTLEGFADKSFDIAHSNSVIEHVGDWGQMKRFAHAVHRVAGAYFIQTPSFWFPIEPHCMVPFFHWLPKPIRVKLVMRKALGHWKRADNVDEAMQIVESARLLDAAGLAPVFPDTVYAQCSAVPSGWVLRS